MGKQKVYWGLKPCLLAKHKARPVFGASRPEGSNAPGRNKQIMKRYGNLYHKIYDMDNIHMAHENAKRGKKHYHEVKMVDTNPEFYFEHIQSILKNKTFQNSEYKVFIKKGKKDRTIHKLPYYPDRIIHHCIVQVLEPIWVSWLIKDTLACLSGRGIHKGVKRIKQMLRTDPEGTCYCLKMDVKKFYPSVDHDVLKGLIRRKIKDNDLLWLLDEIIDSEPGIPIGNYLSQYFGNLYLSGFDHWMKEEKGCKNYYRYCDDVVVLCADKSRLHELRKEVEQYLNNELNLKLKENWQIFPVDKRGIDFLGYRFYHGYTLLRKSITKRMKNRLKTIQRKGLTLNPVQVISSVMSYYGWLKHANCRNLLNKYFNKDIFWIVKQKAKEANQCNPLQGLI